MKRNRNNLFIFILFYFLFLLPFINPIEINLNLIRVSKSMIQTGKNYIENDYFYLVPILIGTPPQVFDVLYDTSFPYLMLNPVSSDYYHNFNYSLSTTFKQIGNNISILDCNGSIVNDLINIEKEKLELNWLYANQTKEDYLYFEGVFGIPRNKKEFNIIQNLYDEGKIKHKLFGHKYDTDRNLMKLYFGEINDEIFINKFNNKENYPKCFINKSSKILSNINPDLENVFSCMVNKVQITNSQHNLIKEINIDKYPVIFSTGKNEITGPLEIGDIILDLILKEVSDSVKCTKIVFKNNKKNIICRWNLNLYSLPTLNFDLDGVTLSIEPQNYFYKEFDISGDKFMFKGRFEFGDEKYFTFGQSILRNYDMVFNLEKNYVGFWNLNQTYGQGNIKIIGIIVVIVIILVILVVSGMYYLRNKRKSNINYQKQQNSYDKIVKLNEINEIEQVNNNS